jgi:hypothetical protein
MEFTSLTKTNFGIFPIPFSAFGTNRLDFKIFGVFIDNPVSLKDSRWDWDSGLDFETVTP